MSFLWAVYTPTGKKKMFLWVIFGHVGNDFLERPIAFKRKKVEVLPDI